VNELKRPIALALLSAFVAHMVYAATPPPAPAGPPPPEPIFGVQVVIDPEHIVTTLQQIAIDRAQQALAERTLRALQQVPFTDAKNYTGAFLANMEWLFAGEETEAPSIAFVREDLAQVLEEIFPPWASFERRSTEILGRLESVTDWERMIYTVRKEEMQRILAVLHEHSAQLSRERQGLLLQRLFHNITDGHVEHLQMISAGIQQLADAQSVSRQLEMVRLNTEIVDRLEEKAREAQRRAAVLEILDYWAPPGSEVPLMGTRGLTVTG
jgi:plasmid stabilization system protein ParE